MKVKSSSSLHYQKYQQPSSLQALSHSNSRLTFATSNSTLPSRGVSPARSLQSTLKLQSPSSTLQQQQQLQQQHEQSTIGSPQPQRPPLIPPRSAMFTVKSNYKDVIRHLQSNPSLHYISQDISSDLKDDDIPLSPSPLKSHRSVYSSPNVESQTHRLKNMSKQEKRAYLKTIKKMETDVQVLNQLRNSSSSFTWREFQPSPQIQELLSATQERTPNDLIPNLRAKEKSMEKPRLYRFDRIVAKRLLEDRVEGDRIRSLVGEGKLAKNLRELNGDRANLNKKMVAVSSQFVSDMNLYNSVFCSALDYATDPNHVPPKELKVNSNFILKQDSTAEQRSPNNIPSHLEEQQQRPPRKLTLANTKDEKHRQARQNTERQIPTSTSSVDQSSNSNGGVATGGRTPLRVSLQGQETNPNRTVKHSSMISSTFEGINLKMDNDAMKLRAGINRFRDIFTPINSELKKELKVIIHEEIPNQHELFQLIRLNKDECNYQKIELMLLSNPSLANAVDSTQSTGLHWAAKRNSVSIANLLLRYGANKTALDSLGRTPLSIAHEQSHFQVYKVLASR